MRQGEGGLGLLRLELFESDDGVFQLGEEFVLTLNTRASVIFCSNGCDEWFVLPGKNFLRGGDCPETGARDDVGLCLQNLIEFLR